jgi:hypothetical protein
MTRTCLRGLGASWVRGLGSPFLQARPKNLEAVLVMIAQPIAGTEVTRAYEPIEPLLLGSDPVSDFVEGRECKSAPLGQIQR